MKALMLAAGLGSRLAPLTDRIPKSLVEVNGEPIAFRQIRALQAAGIDDITLVAGYLSDVMKSRVSGCFDNVHVVVNHDYATTNNMHSAAIGIQAMGAIDDGMLMMNADVFIDYSVVKALVDFPAPNAVVVDIGSYLEESMKVIASPDGRLLHISKQISEDDALGCSIDVYKFSPQGVKAFEDRCKNYIENYGEEQLWSEVALDDTFDNVRFEACPLIGRWCEIDDSNDLASAEQLFMR